MNKLTLVISQDSSIITSEGSGKSFCLVVQGKSFWQFDPARPSSYCKPYISATMRVIISKQKPNNAHFSKL